MEDAMQAKITELKKRQEALRKGLENMAKEKGANNADIVKKMDVNTTPLDSSSMQDLIKTIMPQHPAGEGCSGANGPNKEDSEQDESYSGRSVVDYLGANSPVKGDGEWDESDSAHSAEDGAICFYDENSEWEDSNSSLRASSPIWAPPWADSDMKGSLHIFLMLQYSCFAFACYIIVAHLFLIC